MGKPFEGRVALVSGASRGIGRAIAIKLAEHGADVAVNYRREADAAAEVVAAIDALGRRAMPYSCSVDDVVACRTMVDQIIEDFGAIDILVNNAGIASRGKSVADTDPGEVARVVATHAFGAFNLSHLAMPHLMRAPRGDIVNISSIAARHLAPNGAPYNMAKAAIEALSDTLAKEVNDRPIYVNVVGPGLTVTDMGERLAKATTGVGAIDELDPLMPFGHVCSAEEVANVVAFLCSPANTYITGQHIYLDGARVGGLPRR
jgi:NAD(P)-dependent dehydrogenase (short-subunit alcohol dehydrogenase family)